MRINAHISANTLQIRIVYLDQYIDRRTANMRFYAYALTKKIRMPNSTMYYGSILDFIFSDVEDKRKKRANVPWLICFASTRTLESAPSSSRETFSRGQEAADAISRETY